MKDYNQIKLIHTKVHQIRSKLKSGSTQELLDSLANVIAELINDNNISLEPCLATLYENNIYYYNLISEIFKLISVKLKDVYGIEMDIAQLQKEAEDNLDKAWPEIRKNLADHSSVARQINDIFDKPEGGAK